MPAGDRAMDIEETWKMMEGIQLVVTLQPFGPP